MIVLKVIFFSEYVDPGQDQDQRKDLKANYLLDYHNNQNFLAKETAY